MPIGEVIGEIASVYIGRTGKVTYGKGDWECQTRFSTSIKKRDCLGANSHEWDLEGDRIALTPTPPPYPSASSPSKTEEPPAGYTIDEAIDRLGYGPFQFLLFHFCGCMWVADSMELIIIAILSPAVKCHWSLTSVEEAFITSIVFIGFLCGSTFWGYIGDNFGRKKAFIGISIMVLTCGILCAVKLTPNDDRIPGYPWLLLCRFGVGFGVSGISQSATYYIEFLPRKMRAACTLGLVGWLAVGTILGAAMAVGLLGSGKYDWHWYIGLSATPIALVTRFVFFVPESARVLLSRGKKKEAIIILKKMERLNFRSLPPGELVVPSLTDDLDNEEDKEDKNTAIDGESTCSEKVDSAREKQPLLRPKSKDKSLKVKVSASSRIRSSFVRMNLLFAAGMWKTTVPLCLLWFGTTWLYYGCILLTTEMLRVNPHCDSNDGNGSNSSNRTACEDEELDTGDYLKIMWASAAEFPGILFTVAIIEIVGRKLTMVVNFAIALVGYSLLYICTSEIVLTVFFFIIRAAATGLFQVMYVYTPEVYPTRIRGFAMGFVSSVARLGAIITPYVAQVLFRVSDYATISIYGGTCLVLGFVALMLPIETKGKHLKA